MSRHHANVLILGKAGNFKPILTASSFDVSAGKSLRAPEASKIYVGSFWGHPYEVTEWADLFEEDRKQLFDGTYVLTLTY